MSQMVRMQSCMHAWNKVNIPTIDHHGIMQRLNNIAFVLELGSLPSVPCSPPGSPRRLSMADKGASSSRDHVGRS